MHGFWIYKTFNLSLSHYIESPTKRNFILCLILVSRGDQKICPLVSLNIPHVKVSKPSLKSPSYNMYGKSYLRVKRVLSKGKPLCRSYYEVFGRRLLCRCNAVSFILHLWNPQFIYKHIFPMFSDTFSLHVDVFFSGMGSFGMDYFHWVPLILQLFYWSGRFQHTQLVWNDFLFLLFSLSFFPEIL